MGLYAGIDYGTRRIGLALSDANAKFAFPAETLAGVGAVTRDAANVLKWAMAHQAAVFVVGLPLHMDGSAGEQAQLTQRFADHLRKQSGLPVELWDERLTSFQADEHLDAAGLRGKRRTALRDALAAQVILQSFLDSRNRTA